MAFLPFLIAAWLAAPSAAETELVLPVTAPPGSEMPDSLEIFWFGDPERPWWDEPDRRPVEGGRVSLTPRERAHSFSALGPGLSSRRISLEEARRSGIALHPSGTVILEAASPIREPIRVWIAEESGAVSERRFAPPPDGGRTVQFVLPRGRYGIGVEQGADGPRTYLVGGDIGSFLSEHRLPDVRREPVTVAVRDKSTGAPLEGAWFSTSSHEPLLPILRAWVPRTGTDGLLRFGRIDPDLLRGFQVDLQGRRSVDLADGSPEHAVRREVLLPRYQSVEVKVQELSPERLASKPPISIGLCRNLNTDIACPPEDWVSAEIHADGKALFEFVPPGRYLIQPSRAAQKSDSKTADSSARASDPDVVTVWISLQEYAYRGRVRFADGRPAQAIVRATARRLFLDEGDELFRTRSSPDGSFEMRFVTNRGPTVSAVSDDSSAQGDWRGEMSGRRDADGYWSGEILLSKTALELTLRDRNTRQPLADCVLRLHWKESKPPEQRWTLGGGGSLRVGPDGRATLKGFRGGRVKVLPECADHARANGFDFSLEAEERKAEEILLDETSDFTIRVVDPSGSPIADAAVLAHPFDQTICSAGDCVTYLGPFKGREDALVSGRDWSGAPLYVAAPGSRLSVVRFAPRVCAATADCTYTVTPTAPSPFPGLAVRAPANSTVQRLIFSLDGEEIPHVVLQQTARVAKFPEVALMPRREGDVFISDLPAFLPDGEYQVSAYVIDPSDNRSGTSVPIGVLRLPATKRVELAVPAP